MAIQNRRGAYRDFDPTKMVDGEFAVVKSGDPDGSGKAVYISFESGTADRLALFEDLEEYGGKIDAITVNGGEELPIVDKTVDIPIPTVDISAAAGDIVEFSTGGDNMPMKAVEVSMSPIQSLNGYSSPWPDGGGKNLLPPLAGRTASGITFTANADSSITASGTATENAYTAQTSVTLPAGTFILSGCPSGGGSSKYRLYINGGANDYGSGAEFTLSAETTLNVAIRIDSGQTVNNLVFKPMIRLATDTDPTYEPYSNICPITGRTGASVVVAGGNLIGEMENGYVAGNGQGISPSSSSREMVSGFIPVEEGKDYIYEFSPVNVTTTPWTGYCFYSAADMSAPVGSRVVTSEADAITITPPSGAKYIRIGSRFLQGGGTAEFRVKTTYPITFTSAGTVYAGTVDLVSGRLVATHIMRRSMDFSSYAKGGSTEVSNFYFRPANADKPPTGELYGADNIICSHAKSRESYSTTEVFAYSGSAQPRIVFPISYGINTLADFTTWLDEQEAAGTPLQFCYKLATPLTYNLTPVQVMSLLGENVVWSEDGEISNLKYSADISLVVADLYSKLSS